MNDRPKKFDYTSTTCRGCGRAIWAGDLDADGNCCYCPGRPAPGTADAEVTVVAPMPALDLATAAAAAQARAVEAETAAAEARAAADTAALNAVQPPVPGGKKS